MFHVPALTLLFSELKRVSKNKGTPKKNVAVQHRSKTSTRIASTRQFYVDISRV